MVNKFEQLAVWYLWLNGYFTVPSFVLHPDARGSQRTETDVLAVRFPHSCEELAGKKLETDSNLVFEGSEKIDFIIAEVKKPECSLNDTWTKPQLENMQYVLKWMGIIPKEAVQDVAESMYSKNVCEREKWIIRIVCFGKQRSKRLPANVLQLTHEQVLKFISERFRQHQEVKSNHQQWDEFITHIYQMAVDGHSSTSQILEWLANGRLRGAEVSS